MGVECRAFPARRSLRSPKNQLPPARLGYAPSHKQNPRTHMIGWYLAIYQQTPLERVASHDRTTLLASWEVGIGGLAWLDKLVAEGKAERLSRNGYPSRYTARAKDVFPLIGAGPPTQNDPLVLGVDYVRPSGWTANLLIEQSKVDACPAEQILTIDAWDQS
jgi:hypothetical protein